MDVISNYLLESILVIIVIIIILGAMAWFSIIHSKMKDLEPIRKHAIQIIGTSEKIDLILRELAALNQRVDGLTRRVDGLTRRVDGLTQRVDGLTERVDGLTDSPYARNSSPVSLNEAGKQLSEKMDADSIADKYTDRLSKRAIEQNMNAYQIQQSCFRFSANEILKDLETDKERYDQLSEVAYTEGVRLENLMRILGLVLRDRVLEAVNESHGKLNQLTSSSH